MLALKIKKKRVSPLIFPALKNISKFFLVNMCFICKKKRELNIYISGMTDLEYKLLFSVMAGCGYELFLCT